MAEAELSLKRAVKLFNRWQFQESADAFAALAGQAEGRDRTFLEGLSNISSAFFRIWNKGGEPNAMVSYLEKGIEQLRPFARGAMGVATEKIIPDLELCLEEAMRWRRRESEIYNRDLIPRLDYSI